MAGGSASALSLSRPAQALRVLRPVGSLSYPRSPLSRGFSPASCPAKPLVSFRTYRQLSGWNPPPLVIRAYRAHCQLRTHASQQNTVLFDHFISTSEQCRRHGETECFRRFEVNHQFVLGRRLDRKFGWLLAFKDPVQVGCSPSIWFDPVGTVGD